MRNRRMRWLSGLGAVILSGGLLAGCGSSDDAAIAQSAPTDVSGVTQAWNKNLPAAQRFVVLAAFANGVVMDRETGLVWEKSPTTTTHTWNAARDLCMTRTTGGRKGWRLPSVHELASLIDPTVAAPGPMLPAGHPFPNVQLGAWSATTIAGSPNSAWNVGFSSGVSSGVDKSSGGNVWCVRGGHNDGSEY